MYQKFKHKRDMKWVHVPEIQIPEIQIHIRQEKIETIRKYTKFLCTQIYTIRNIHEMEKTNILIFFKCQLLIFVFN